MENKVILLADDDRDDTDLFCEALQRIDARITCHCIVNGTKVLSTLHALKEKPQLIFLDINMPILSGLECLRLLKADEGSRSIPVIMMSTSSHEKEIDLAFASGALCYLVKPINFNELKQMLGVIVTHLGPGLLQALAKLKADGSKHVFVP